MVELRKERKGGMGRERDKERRGKHGCTRRKTGEKTRIFLCICLSLTLYAEQRDGRAGCGLADGGQGVTGVRGQQAEQRADFKVLWGLRDKGAPEGMGWLENPSGHSQHWRRNP